MNGGNPPVGRNLNRRVGDWFGRDRKNPTRLHERRGCQRLLHAWEES